MWMGFASLMPIISGWQNHKDRAQGTEHYECSRGRFFLIICRTPSTGRRALTITRGDLDHLPGQLFRR
jgi:hypothetical protein